MKRALVLLLALHAAYAAALDAPNVVTVSPRLVTSGQPTAKSLASLREEGFTAVVHLVPSGRPDAVAREAETVREQGLAYARVPIQWEQPGSADYDAFAGVMKGLPDGKVLVHCQVNLMASTMTFLYRAVALGEPAEQAYDSVAAVWSPNAVWKRYVKDELTRASVMFEPY